MENEIHQIDFFNCKKRFFYGNKTWSLSYQSLPEIMSALKVDNVIPPASNPNEVLVSSVSKQPLNIVDKLDGSITSDSDEEYERVKLPERENKHDNSMRTRFRELRSRTPESLMRINRRTIAKPKKLKDVNLTPSAIKKLYTESGKKLGRFKPSNLETIFEESVDNNTADQLKLLGKKKLKRSLSCSDGLNITKATIKSRRQKIKRIFGKRFALKKINLAVFKEKLNSSMEDIEDLDTCV